MEATVTVENFKGLARAQVKFVGTSLLCGVNSSAKSSFIHAMLLLRQSAGSRMTLNGPLVTLGEAKDVIRNGAETMSISFDFPESGGSLPRLVRRNAQMKGTFERNESSFKKIKHEHHGIKFDFIQDSKNPSELKLKEATYRAGRMGVKLSSANRAPKESLDNDGGSSREYLYLQVPKLEVDRSRRDEESTIYIKYAGLEAVSFVVRFNANTFRERLEYALNNPHEFAMQALYMEGMIEEGGELNEFKPFAEDYHRIVRELEKRPFAIAERVVEMLLVKRIRDVPFSEFDAEARESRSYREAGKISLEKFFLRIPEHDYLKFRSSSLHSTGELAAVESLFLYCLREDFSGIVSAVDRANQSFRNFMSMLLYVGPVRQAPRVASSLQKGALPTPVGMSGEFTGSRLIDSGSKLATFGLPLGDAQPKNEIGIRPLAKIGFQKKKASTVLNVWLQYLGIAESVNVREFGKFGIVLEAQKAGTSRDLTSLGVGVSQLLPVLVLVLTARSGSTILVEQPELHLHPEAQSSLMTFLIYARPDVEILCETHSEYMAVRARREAVALRYERNRAEDARDFGSAISSICCSPDIYFSRLVEANGGKHGHQVDRLKVDSQSGDISEWPRGFFDTLQLELMELMMQLEDNQNRS